MQLQETICDGKKQYATPRSKIQQQETLSNSQNQYAMAKNNVQLSTIKAWPPIEGAEISDLCNNLIKFFLTWNLIRSYGP